jgi:hypothetical protein
MNIKFAIKQVSQLAAVVLSSSKLSMRLDDVANDLEAAFKVQAQLDGVVGKSTVTFGSVSVLKTFKRFFDADEAVILSALWAVVVAVDKSERQTLADLRPSESSTV